MEEVQKPSNSESCLNVRAYVYINNEH
jgi:hypothetical protein